MAIDYLRMQARTTRMLRQNGVLYNVTRKGSVTVMGELGIVEAEQAESGGLTIRLFKRKYMLSDEGEIVKTKGEPMDVPVNSWIDVRLDMPDDSAFNQMINQKLQP